VPIQCTNDFAKFFFRSTAYGGIFDPALFYAPDTKKN
jgi:hypothetical protein